MDLEDEADGEPNEESNPAYEVWEDEEATVEEQLLYFRTKDALQDLYVFFYLS